MDPMRRMIEDIVQRQQAQADDCAAVKAEVRASLEIAAEAIANGKSGRSELARGVAEIYGRGNQLCPGCQRELLDMVDALCRISELER